MWIVLILKLSCSYMYITSVNYYELFVWPKKPKKWKEAWQIIPDTHTYMVECALFIALESTKYIAILFALKITNKKPTNHFYIILALTVSNTKEVLYYCIPMNFLHTWDIIYIEWHHLNRKHSLICVGLFRSMYSALDAFRQKAVSMLEPQLSKTVTQYDFIDILEHIHFVTAATVLEVLVHWISESMLGFDLFISDRFLFHVVLFWAQFERIPAKFAFSSSQSADTISCTTRWSMGLILVCTSSEHM